MSTWTMNFDTGRVEAHFAASADDAAAAIGEHILAVGNSHVPLEEATLERSGAVTEPEDGEAVVYWDTPYAVVQHEDLTFQHDPGRTAKWAENAMNSERAAAAAIAQQYLALP